MQQFNFSPLDFSRIPQQETEARRNWYDSLSGLVNTFGQGVQKIGETQSAIDQRNLAEEWKQKQWNNQRWQQDLANKRYEDEQRRLADERSRNSVAAAALRKQFLEKYNYGSLEKYGPGAQFALSQIENAPDYQGVVAGGNTLSNIINQRDMIDAQRAEEAREEFVPSFLKEYDTQMARDIGYDFNKPEQFPSMLKKSDLENTKYRMVKEISYLETLMDSDPRYRTREVVNRLNALKTSLTGIDMRMNPRGYTKF